MSKHAPLRTTVVMLSGPTASGKSAMARRLTRWLRKHDRRRSAVIVAADECHTDDAKKQMSAGKPVTDTYRKRTWAPRLELALGVAVRSNPGAVIIVDCSGLKLWLRERVRRAVSAHATDFVLVWLDVVKADEGRAAYEIQLAELQERVRERLRKGTHWASPDIVADQILQFERPTDREQPLVLPALGGRKKGRDQILSKLGYQPGRS